MNRDLRSSWLEALRSGEYQQTYGELHRSEPSTHNRDGDLITAPAGYCCLGVLADICTKRWPDQFRWFVDNEIVYPKVQLFDGEDPEHMVLTGDDAVTVGDLGWMAELVGLPDPQQSSLISLNDGGQGFPVIADFIEENVPEDDTPYLWVQA